MRELTYLTIVGNTAYFFCKETDILLPITVTGKCINNILNFNNHSIVKIHNTFFDTLKSFNTKIVKIKLLSNTRETLLSYITIKRGRKYIDVKMGFEDCLVFASSSEIKIEIEENLLMKMGFHVTREMIEKALTESNTI